ncbi:serine protease SPPA, chloroplastic [Trifolium repens]|nr:serine protease SPPA, chloroplastic [Trifolium repens]
MSLPQPTVSTHSSCLTLILKLKPLHNHSSSNSTLKQDSVSGSNDDNYPTGDFEFKPVTSFHKFIVKLRTLMADSSEHVQHGSVLKITLRGQISEQFLPGFCDNLLKAVYDPRISGVYLDIDNVDCGWAKLDEIRRQIVNFRKSGKFVAAYLPLIREKEYYIACACEEIYAPPSASVALFGFTVEGTFVRGVYDNLGIEPQIERIGKYKRAGDKLIRKTMSEDHREMLTALLDNISSNWLDKVSSARGKKREDIENFVNEGVYQVDRLKEEGFITSILYDDEVIPRLKKKLQVKSKKYLPMVYFSKYSAVQKWTVGISGGKELIAVIRASGTISRVGGKGIIGEKFISEIRGVRASKKYKAAIIRIDSPGGDALASDLMWREIRLLAAKIPVIASMSDMAASGGYYIAMGANAIVAESLTLTGSIGVVTKKFNYEKLDEMIGFNKEVISWGKYAELFVADHRSFRPHEAELFAKKAQNIYKQFRDKAALSRSMTVDKMEEVAQGRVWTGKDAVSHGLVDAIGGLSRAIAIAKLKANIPQDRQVLRSVENSLVGADQTCKEQLLQDLTFSDGIQARMDEIMFQ